MSFTRTKSALPVALTQLSNSMIFQQGPLKLKFLSGRGVFFYPVCHLVALCFTHRRNFIHICLSFIYLFIYFSCWDLSPGPMHARQALYLSYIPAAPSASLVEIKKWRLGSGRASPEINASVHCSILDCYAEDFREVLAPSLQPGIAMGKLTTHRFLSRCSAASQHSFSSCEKST